MIIDVYRDDGLRSGEPIVEPLLSDDALIHRGRAEMDAHARPVDRVELEVVFRPGLRLGQLVEASDPTSASTYKAKIVGLEISVSEALIETRVTLERPR